MSESHADEDVRTDTPPPGTGETWMAPASSRTCAPRCSAAATAAAVSEDTPT